jgi:hypothetical protein
MFNQPSIAAWDPFINPCLQDASNRERWGAANGGGAAIGKNLLETPLRPSVAGLDRSLVTAREPRQREQRIRPE